MTRERRVVTPDGHVWFVRRRRAMRRGPWRRGPDRPGARFAAEEELPTDGERIVPPLVDTFSTVHNDGSTPDRFHDDRHAADLLTFVLVIAFMVVSVLIGAFAEYVVPWLLPLLADNVWPLAGVVAVAASLVVLDRLRRPWLVELQRQGLADAPRRVWRVRGWRRSGRLMDEVAAAVREGRTDGQRGVLLSARSRRPSR